MTPAAAESASDPRPVLVLLPAAKDTAQSWAPVRASLESTFRVLMPSPDPAGSGSESYELAGAADQVTAALDAAGAPRAAICGVGLGAMVALQLGAAHPDRVSHLVLVTRQTALSPLLLSLPAVVLRLLPATAVQRLGAGKPQVLALLDQVRPVDATPLAARVSAPSLVLCGARDRLNRRASRSLAEALPHGDLRLLPAASPTWPTDSPSLLAEALTTFLTTP